MFAEFDDKSRLEDFHRLARRQIPPSTWSADTDALKKEIRKSGAR